MGLSKADPRNPQPGQVWERDGHRNEVSRVCVFRDLLSGKELWFEEALVAVGGRYFGMRRWRRWACPFWRRRKHWAKCVEWKR